MNQFIYQRIAMYMVGVLFMTFGVALSCKADLGTSPISSVPWVLSLATPWSVGWITIVFNIIFIVAQPMMLGTIYWRPIIGQWITIVLFGYFIDFFMEQLHWLVPANVWEQWFVCILSTVVLAFGVFIVVRAKLFLAPGESIVNVLSFVTKRPFALWKNIFDISQVVMSVAISYYYFGELRGVGGGTLAAAILVGRFVQFYANHVKFFDRWKVE